MLRHKGPGANFEAAERKSYRQFQIGGAKRTADYYNVINSQGKRAFT